MKPFEAQYQIPEKEPYEGKATQKQKQKLWELGIRDREVIDDLGKKQASYLIGKALQTHTDLSKSHSSRNLVILGFLILTASVVAVFYSEGANYDESGIMLLIIMGFLLGPLMIIWGGIKSLYYKMKLKSE